MSFNPETNMYEGYIYKIYNDVNDLVYIGQTTQTIKERWHGHKSSAIDKSKMTPLYKAMRYHGREKFHIEQIECVVAEHMEDLVHKLNKLEIYYITKYNSLVGHCGYNVEEGGIYASPPESIKRKVCKYDIYLHLLESYNSITEAAKKNNTDVKHIIRACKGKRHMCAGFIWAYENEKPKQLSFMIGVSLDKILKTPEENKYYFAIYENHLIDKPIIRYDNFGNIITRYSNPIIAAKELGINCSELKIHLDNNRTYFNTILKYEGEKFDINDFPSHMRPLDIYDFYGNYIASVGTLSKACDYLNYNKDSISNITKAIKQGKPINRHFIVEHGKQLIRNAKHFYLYHMIDDNNNIIKVFDSVADIIEYLIKTDPNSTTLREPHITKAIKNHTKLNGYYWDKISGVDNSQSYKGD